MGFSNKPNNFGCTPCLPPMRRTMSGPISARMTRVLASLDPRNRREALDLLLVWMQVPGNLRTHPLNGFIKPINISELFTQKKAMVRLDLPLQGLREQVTFGAHPAACQFG
jgi:hypothetical protein